jgi:hypothetical protein
MKRIAFWVFIFSLGIGTALAVLFCARVTVAQDSGQRIPIISDWSHRHVVFSRPLTDEQARTLRSEPRYWMQLRTGHHIHSGDFDNTYLTSGGSAGSMYICGSSSNSTPTIQRVEFSSTGSTFANPAGTMNSTVDAAKLAVASSSAECFPVTEFFNPSAPTASQDQIFFGVQNLGSGTNCGGAGCVMSINVTNTPTSFSIANSIAEIGGPSGIIVDGGANTTTFPQASRLYFSNQGNSTAGVLCGTTSSVGCAVKVTQAALN